MKRTRLVGLLAEFRIYLPRRMGRGFWDVMIFETPRDLREYAASDQMRGGYFKAASRALGLCRALRTETPLGNYLPSPRGSRGFIVLCLSGCGVGIVSHEMTHAAYYELAFHQGREPLTLKDDESLAFLQGEFVRRFWNSFYRRFRQRGRRWVRLAK